MKIKTSPKLDPFTLDQCIEQFKRGNWPNYEGIELIVFMTILQSWLEELKALRIRCDSYQATINWRNHKINDLEYELQSIKESYGKTKQKVML